MTQKLRYKESQMRWLTLDPRHPDDVAFRQLWLDKIDRFWHRFLIEVKPAVESQQMVVRPMMEAIAQVSDEIMWEMAPPPNSEVTLTCESSYALRPLVDEMIRRAPDVSGWKFFSRRPALPLHLVRKSIEAKARKKSSLAGMELGLNRIGNVEVSLDYPLISIPDDKADFIRWCEGLFGEEALDHWVTHGNTHRKLIKVNDDWLGPARAQFDSLKAKQRASRPSIPWRENTSTHGALLQTTTPNGVILVNTRDPELGTALVQDPLFCSSRFSVCGETFAYLHLPRFNDVQQRTLIDDRVAHDLGMAKLGGVTGAQTWPEHSRVDLALEDLSRMDDLRSVLSAMALPGQTWLRFYDRDLEDEWLGFPNDRSAPPVRHTK